MSRVTADVADLTVRNPAGEHLLPEPRRPSLRWRRRVEAAPVPHPRPVDQEDALDVDELERALDAPSASLAELLDTDVVVLLRRALHKQRRAAGSTIAVLTRQLEEQRAAADTHARDAAAAQAELAETRQRLERAAGDLIRWRSQADGLTGALRVCEGMLEQRDRDLADEQQRRTAAEERALRAEAQLVVVTTDAAAATGELEKGREHVADLATRLTESQHRAANLEVALMEADAKAQQSRHLESLLKRARLALIRTMEDVEEEARHNVETQAYLDVLVPELDTLRAENARLRADVDNLTGERDAARRSFRLVRRRKPPA